MAADLTTSELGGHISNPFDFRQPESASNSIANVSDWAEFAPPPPLTVAGPPLPWLIGAASTALLAGLLAFIFGGFIPVAFVAWFLAGPVAIALLGAFMSFDIAARTKPVYVSPTWLPWAVRGLVILLGIGVAISSWQVADWASRL